MKRTIAIMLAIMTMAAALTACSGTAYTNDGFGYGGNVSSTPDGRVNGGNGTGGYGYNGYSNGQAGGSSHGGGYGAGTGTGNNAGNGGLFNGANGAGSGSGTGTGMTGGR